MEVTQTCSKWSYLQACFPKLDLAACTCVRVGWLRNYSTASMSQEEMSSFDIYPCWLPGLQQSGIQAWIARMIYRLGTTVPLCSTALTSSWRQAAAKLEKLDPWLQQFAQQLCFCRAQRFDRRPCMRIRESRANALKARHP